MMWPFRLQGYYHPYMYSFIILLILIVLFLILYLARRNRFNQDDLTQVLKERLAKGEINIEEYHRIKDTIHKNKKYKS